jgi:predicted transcriptional regulator
MPRDVTPAELAVLQVLWDRGPASRRQLTDALYPGGGPAQYATVQKLLERLEAKGYVRHDPGPATLTFAAAVGRDELISRRLLDVADQLCGGAVAPLLTNLIQAKPLTPEELAELRALVERLRPAAKPKGKSR